MVVESFDEYAALVHRFPQLSTSAAADEVDEASSLPGYGPVFARAALLVEGARSGDLRGAWAAHRAATAEAERRANALEPVQAELDAAMEARDYKRVRELVDQALPAAIEIGLGGVVCLLLDQRGVSFLNSATEERADDLETAIESFQAALEVAVSGAQAAGLLMHLGLALGERIHGDRADNLELAIGALRDALTELENSDDDEQGELQAMVLTNLAVALGRSEREDRVAVAREAVQLCREALRVRSVQRNADDWAYSQLNLGDALQDLSELGEVDAIEARAAFQAVIDHAADIRDHALVGAAHQLLGRVDLASTRRSPEDYLDAYDDGTLEDEPDPTPALRAARDHLEAARDLIKDPIRRAHALHSLSVALNDLGDIDESIAAVREALTVIRPTTDPTSAEGPPGT